MEYRYPYKVYCIHTVQYDDSYSTLPDWLEIYEYHQ